MGKTFVALSSEKIAEKIRLAKNRVAVVAPSVHAIVGEALCQAVDRLGSENVDVVTDLDEKVFRLGYGSIEAFKVMKEHHIKIRHHKGLRIGLLVIDDNAWSYSPVALYIEREHAADDLPNAVALSSEEANRIIFRISENARKEAIKSAEADPKLAGEARAAEVELSQFCDNSKKLDEVSKGLEEAPPVPFDISRQVQVFEPYIQYVELSLKGCSIQKHKIKLPKSVMGLSSTGEVEDRLSTTFNLIERSSSLSSKKLDDQVKNLRDNFTRSLGTLGRVVLKAQRNRFDAEVGKIQEGIVEHQNKIEKELELELAISMNQLTDYYLPIVLERPPIELLGQIMNSKPTKGEAISWLVSELDGCIPEPKRLIGNMIFECNFKDVTYETLKDEKLGETLKKEFPHVNWGKPFKEFTAAKETEA